MLAYGELTAFTRLAGDSELAPTQPLKAAMAGLAVTEFRHYEILVATARTSSASTPSRRWRRSSRPIDAFHERTRPSSWLEGLVKAYVGDGIATDFYREIAAYVDAVDPGAGALGACERRRAGGLRRQGGPRRHQGTTARIGGRLALWGRRLVGEALSQAQQVAVERDAMASLLVGGVGGPDRPSADLAELGRMFARLTDEHTRRMGRLGLAA